MESEVALREYLKIIPEWLVPPADVNPQSAGLCALYKAKIKTKAKRELFWFSLLPLLLLHKLSYQILLCFM